jgi:PAS domain S-box-containing protein
MGPRGVTNGSGKGIVEPAPGTVQIRLALLEALLDASDDAVFSLDLDGRVTSWNRSAERIFGYGEAEIIGEGSATLFVQHLRRDVSALLASVSGGNRVSHFETEIQRKDGMPAPISLSARPVVDREGRLVASAVIARDITEQLFAQATLAEIETRVRDSEALAHVGGWLWDVRTGAVQWTDELHRIQGVDPLEFDGTFEAHVACVHHDDQPAVRAALEDCVASGRPFEKEYRIVRPDGDVRWLYARAAPTIGSAGTVVGLRGIAQDMTDRGGATGGPALDGRAENLTPGRRES